MKLNNILLVVSVVSFYYLLNKFLELDGLKHQLLKILLELILVLFLMILLKYQEEIKEITEYEKNQKKICDFFKRNGNKII